MVSSSFDGVQGIILRRGCALSGRGLVDNALASCGDCSKRLVFLLRQTSALLLLLLCALGRALEPAVTHDGANITLQTGPGRDVLVFSRNASAAPVSLLAALAAMQAQIDHSNMEIQVLQLQAATLSSSSASLAAEGAALDDEIAMLSAQLGALHLAGALASTTVATTTVIISSPTTTSPLTFDGNLTNPLSGAITTYTAITGSLLFNESDTDIIVLPNLHSIGFLWVLQCPSLTLLSMPALTFLSQGAVVVNGNVRLPAIVFPALTNITNRFTAVDNPAATLISLPVLTRVGLTVTIQNNAALTSVNLPALTSVGMYSLLPSLDIDSNAALTSIVIPALTTVPNGSFPPIYICQNGGSVNINVSVPTGANCSRWTFRTTQCLLCYAVYDGDLQCNSTQTGAAPLSLYSTVLGSVRVPSYPLSFVYAPMMTSIAGELMVTASVATAVAFPVLTHLGRYLLISNTTALTLASFPLLTFIGGNVVVSNNPALLLLLAPIVASVGSCNTCCTSCGTCNPAVMLCSNNKAFTYSPRIANAPMGLLCAVAVPPSTCANVTSVACA